MMSAQSRGIHKWIFHLYTGKWWMLRRLPCWKDNTMLEYHYHPPTKLREGNVFICVSLSTGEGSRGPGPMSYPLGYLPPGMTYPGYLTPMGYPAPPSGISTPCKEYGTRDTLAPGRDMESEIPYLPWNHKAGGTHPTGMFSCCVW